MDESEAPHNQHQSENKSAPQPVMDVVPPKPAELPKVPSTPKEEPAPAPAPPPAAHEQAHQHHNKPEKPTINKPPKQSTGSGVGLAIFASVVVVLGLAVLFVYAYLRSKNITAF